MAEILIAGDNAKHISTNATVKVIEVLPKEFMYLQQAKAQCLKSSISEDVGQIFEYDLDNLEKIN